MASNLTVMLDGLAWSSRLILKMARLYNPRNRAIALYAFNELRHHPENIRFTMISQHTISVSEYSDLRINFIKELFRNYLFDYKFSDDAVKYFCKEDHPVKIICRKVKKLNQQLIKLRNKIINTFYMLRSCQEEGQSMLNYTKEDIAKFGLLVQKLKSTKFLSPHYLWDIPKKDHEKECYDSGELTE